MKERIFKIQKLIFSILLLVVFVSFGVNLRVEAAGVTGAADKPDIRISRTDMSPVKEKEEFVLQLKLDNLSPAYSIVKGKLTVTVPEGLSIRDQSNIYYIDGSGIPVHGSNTVDIKLKAGDKISSESLQLGINLEYQYWGREGLTGGSEAYTILLPAQKSPDKTDSKDNKGAPIIQVIREKLDPIKEKESYEFDIKIKNVNEKVKAKNVKVTMTAGSGFTVKGRSSNRFIKEISYDEPYTIPVKIKANKSIEAESLELTVNLTYSYDQGGTLTQGSDSEKISLPAVITPPKKDEQTEGNNKLTPNMIVSSYSYGDKVEAGSNFDLSLSFKNTSKDTSIENIVVSMNTGEGISVSSSSNSFYFDKLGAGAQLPLTVGLKAWEEAKSAAAVLTINCNYEYRVGKNITKGSTTEAISIPVIQPDRFELGKPENVPELTVGEEGYISVPYVNKGKATTSNISATLEGEGFESLSKEIWVGNCNSGANGSIDLILTPTQPGEITAKLIVEYEDPNSEKKKEEVELSFFAQEMYVEPPTDMMPEDVMPEQSSNPKMKLIIISSVVAVTLIVLIIVIKKLKKHSNAKRMERLSHMYDWALSAEEKSESNIPDTKEVKQGEK